MNVGISRFNTSRKMIPGGTVPITDARNCQEVHKMSCVHTEQEILKLRLSSLEWEQKNINFLLRLDKRYGSGMSSEFNPARVEYLQNCLPKNDEMIDRIYPLLENLNNVVANYPGDMDPHRRSSGFGEPRYVYYLDDGEGLSRTDEDLTNDMYLGVRIFDTRTERKYLIEHGINSQFNVENTTRDHVMWFTGFHWINYRTHQIIINISGDNSLYPGDEGFQYIVVGRYDVVTGIMHLIKEMFVFPENLYVKMPPPMKRQGRINRVVYCEPEVNPLDEAFEIVTKMARDSRGWLSEIQNNMYQNDI